MVAIAAYVRVSTPSQVEERSHLRQRKKIAQWAEMNDHEPGPWDDYHDGEDITEDTEWDSIDGEVTGDIHWYEDIAISGTVDSRESYQELLDQFAAHELVIVKNLARFGRSPEKTTKDILEIAEVVDFVAIEDPVDTTTANGRLMMRMVNAFNGWFAEQRKEQAEEMIERRRAEGKPIGRPKKLSEEQIGQVREWRESDLSYSTIAVLVEERFDIEVSRETIRRYCKDFDREVEAQ